MHRVELPFHQEKIAAHGSHRPGWGQGSPTNRDICVCYNQQSLYNDKLPNGLSEESLSVKIPQD